MGKRKMFGLGGIMVLVLAGGLSALGAAVKHEPNFYRQGHVPPGPGRHELAMAFVRDFGQMMASRRSTESWGCHVTEAQINSFFEEVFSHEVEAENLRKLGISSPSVTLDKDHLRVAFRYGSDWFSTVISYDLEIWLVPKEANVIAVKIRSARAGALPISSQSILQKLSEFAQRQDYKVSLYRHEGSSVAVIHLQPNENHPSAILTSLQVDSGSLSIRGKSLQLPPLVIEMPSPTPK